MKASENVLFITSQKIRTFIAPKLQYIFFVCYSNYDVLETTAIISCILKHDRRAVQGATFQMCVLTQTVLKYSVFQLLSDGN